MKEAKLKRRYITLRLLLSILLLGGVGYFLYEAVQDQIVQRLMISVRCEKLFGLKKGSKLIEWPSEDQLGVVQGTSRGSDGTPLVHIELDKTNPAVEKFFTKHVSIDIVRFEIAQGYIRIVHAERFIGPQLAVRFGEPLDQKLDKLALEPVVFEATQDQPPMEGIFEGSLKRTVRFRRNMHSLRKGDLVKNDFGKIIGQVWEVHSDIDQVDVDIAYLNLPEILMYTHESANYYLDRPEFSVEGSNGSPERLLLGPELLCYPDRSHEFAMMQAEELAAVNKAVEGSLGTDLKEDSSLVVVQLQSKTIIRGEDSPPRKHRSQRGEKELFLEHSLPIAVDSALMHRGQEIGWFKESISSDDGNSFYLRVRVYPDRQALVTQDSEFSMEQKLGIKLFEGDPEGLWDSIASIKPELIMPDPKGVVQPRVEMFTPPNAVGMYNFDATELHKQVSAKPLYPQPKPEWLNWRTSKPLGDKVLLESTLPIVQVRITWKDVRGIFKGESHEKVGYALYVKNGDELGLLGAQDLLSLVVDKDKVESASFEIQGHVTPFVGKTKSMGPFLAFKPARLEGIEAIDISQIRSKADGNTSVCIQVPNIGVRVVDKRRLRNTDSFVAIDNHFVSLDPSWHGLPVQEYDVETQEIGKVLGILYFQKSPGGNGSSSVPITDESTRMYVVSILNPNF